MLTVTDFDKLKPTTISVVVKFAKRIDLNAIHSNENIIMMDSNPRFRHSINIGVKRDSKIYHIRLFPSAANIVSIGSIEKAAELIDYVNSLTSVSEGKEEEEFLQIKEISESMVTYKHNIRLKFTPEEVIQRLQNSENFVIRNEDDRKVTFKLNRCTFLVFRNGIILQSSKNQEIARTSFETLIEEL